MGAEPQRAPRRHVRIKCWLRTPAGQLAGFTSNLSDTGAYARLPVSDSRDFGLRAGDRVELGLYLPGHDEALEFSAEVIWTEPHDREATGKGVLGIGVRLVHGPPGGAEHLKSFVSEFLYTVVVVDDNPDNLAFVEGCLRGDYRVLAYTSPKEAFASLEDESVAVIISDQMMPEMSGAQFLAEVSERLPHSHLVKIVLSAYDEAAQMKELINLGRIFHYLRKPIKVDDLRQAVRRAVDVYATGVENERLSQELARVIRRLQRENTYLRKRVVGFQGFENIVGASPMLREALSELERIRRTDATVHIYGETGTGKELVARALHNGGARAEKAFVAQNCGGMNESLLQSTLFGHKKGSFTGAVRDRPGVFQEANQGTLFLDEVAELSPATQASLLRALQQGEVTPVGATRPVKLDVRVVSATHTDLRKEVESGRFREDLYFRLVVITVEIPPLRKRTGDVALLAQHFLELLCQRYGKDIPGFTHEAMVALERHRWPGNVRELENEIERVVVLGKGGEKASVDLLSLHLHLEAETRKQAPPAPELLNQGSFSPGAIDTLLASGAGLFSLRNSFERALLAQALARRDGNRSAVARELDIPRQTLQTRIRKLGLQ